MAQSIRDDDGTSNLSGNPHLTQLVETAIARNPARRAFLKTGLGAALLPFIGGVAACSSDDEEQAIENILGFKSVPTSSADVMVVPEGYRAETLVRWGDPLLAGAPDFRGDASETSFEAELQVGDNHDGMHFFGFKNADGSEKSDSGLLVINHEYINPEYYYAPGTDPANWLLPFTAEKARKALAGHGISVVEVRRKADGSWEYVRGSAYNRRITGYTPIEITGPARGHDLLKTAADPERRRGAGHAQQLRERLDALGHLPHLRGELQRLLRLERHLHAERPREPLRHRQGRLRLPVAHGGPALRRGGEPQRAQPVRLGGGDRPVQPGEQAEEAHGARPLQARERRARGRRPTARWSCTWAATSATSTSTSS